MFEAQKKQGGVVTICNINTGRVPNFDRSKILHYKWNRVPFRTCQVPAAKCSAMIYAIRSLE